MCRVGVKSDGEIFGAAVIMYEVALIEHFLDSAFSNITIQLMVIIKVYSFVGILYDFRS